MNHETPEPAKDAEKDAALAHQRLVDAVQAHQRASREISQTLLGLADHHPARFCDALQKWSDGLQKRFDDLPKRVEPKP